MQLVKNVAIAVRDLLQTLDYAPVSIKEMVNNLNFIITGFRTICLTRLKAFLTSQKL
jgi:hypothetical protein